MPIFNPNEIIFKWRRREHLTVFKLATAEQYVTLVEALKGVPGSHDSQFSPLFQVAQ